VRHLKCYDKEGKLLGTIMAKDEKGALELAQKRNKSVVRVGDKLPDVRIPSQVQNPVKDPGTEKDPEKEPELKGDKK
jgi:hypothetical protein